LRKEAEMAPDEESRSDAGFTLIELLVVFVVIGILASIALDVFLDQRRKGWDAAIESDLRNAAITQETILDRSGSGAYASAVSELLSAGFHPSPDENYFGKAFGMTVSAVGGQDYCLTARSESGQYFGYSPPRGLVSKSGAIDAITCI
jgi:type IV pilus assembly protein PilA